MRPLRAGDAEAVAALRGDTVSEGFLALFGPAARRAFFRAAVDDGDTFGFVAEDGEGITAFVLVTMSARRIERAAVLGNPRLWPRAFATGLRSPTVLARALRRFVAVVMDRGASSPSAEPALRLLDIVVANRARRQGHARAVVAATLEEAWRRGHDAIGLSVLTANGAAVQLYERAGFTTSGGGVRGDGQPFLTMRLDRSVARHDDLSSPQDGTERPEPVAR